MCGINGILDGGITYYEKLMVMHEATSHRGNEMKYSSHENAMVAFNWLKITDESIDFLPNRYNGTIVYLNGFISNYKELSKKYNIKCTTDCDTEFLTRFIDMFGNSKLGELNGFFAVLCYSPIHEGWLSFTDRYGIKQIYKYTNKDGVTFISSEVKGILSVCPEIKQNPKAVQDWHYSLGVMTDDTIYKDIKRVAKLPFLVPEKIDISYKDAKEKLRELWVKSVRRNQYNGQSGVFLSGGIDSGIIAKYFKNEYSFSMDYQDEKYSEIDLIKENSHGIHYSIICNKDFANQYAHKTMKALDDLKAGSCYTNFALAELASKFVKVVYSGAGGDEFFGGYAHRNSKPINDVVCRNGQPILNHKISRFKYDLNFLSAVLVVEGLSPIKKQCYFIPYGNELTCSRSYQGSIALAKRVGGVKDVVPVVIYNDDVFEFEIVFETGRKKITKHEQKFENIDNDKIKGAYAVVIYEDGQTDIEIMNIKEIRQAWNQGASKGNSPAHNNFTQEMCKKTVINRACKTPINSSSDSTIYSDEDEKEPENKPLKETLKPAISLTGQTVQPAGEVSFDNIPEAEIVKEETPEAKEEKTVVEPVAQRP